MSKQTISAKSQIIRNEINRYGNTRGRVADVLDDINESKAETVDLQQEAIDRADADESLSLLLLTETQEREQQEALMLLKPTTTSTTASYPFVVGVDAAGNSARLAAGDLGKNIYNVDGDLTGNRKANLAAFYLNFYNATNTAKVGINKDSPAEALDVIGRIRADAFLLNVNSTAAIANRVRTDGTYLYHANSSAVERRLMYADYADYLALLNGLTDTQKDNLRTASLKTGEAWSKSQAVISSINPPVVLQNPNYVQYVSLIGSNLYIDNTGTSAQVKIVNSAGVETLISNFTVTQNNPNILTFPLPSGQFPTGDYTFKVFNAGVWSSVNPNAKLRVRDTLTSLPVPALTWDAVRNTGDTFTPTNSSESSIEFNNNGGTPSSNIRSREIVISEEMMREGVMLDFTVKFITGNYSQGSTAQGTFGFTENDTLPVNTLFSYGIHSFNNTATFLPSNVGKPMPSGITDKVLVIIADGQITLCVLNIGAVYTQSVVPADLYIKASGTGGGGGIGLSLNKMYSLS